MKQQIAAILVLTTLTACAQPGQNRYDWQDVGKDVTVEFGRVISERQVDITGKNTGVGAGAGMAGGALAGSMIGHGDGTIGGMIAGIVIAGVAGAVAEQAIADHKGIEYTITEHGGKTVTIVQNFAQGDPEIKVGQRVMVQTSGVYHRVLPADNMPTKVKRPKAITVQD